METPSDDVTSAAPKAQENAAPLRVQALLKEIIRHPDQAVRFAKEALGLL